MTDKEIEEMEKGMRANRLEDIYSLSKVIANSVHFGEHNDENMLAQDILDAGYGNVKQAIKEVKEYLKGFIVCNTCVSDDDVNSIYHKIENLITELYGSDE